MKATIQKWGNSLGVRIPGFIAKELSLEHGSPVEIMQADNRIIIEPKKTKGLKEALQLITEENIHKEQFDLSAGDETL